MALGTFIAGSYSGAYATAGLGITRTGFNLGFETHGEIMNESDLYGLSIQEIIGRGTSHFIDFICKEWRAGARAAFQPWSGGSLGLISNPALPLGRLGSAVGGALVLTATLNTPAATLPATLTATPTILAPNQRLDLIFNSVMRETPVRLIALPSDSAGTVTAFTTT